MYGNNISWHINSLLHHSKFGYEKFLWCHPTSDAQLWIRCISTKCLQQARKFSWNAFAKSTTMQKEKGRAGIALTASQWRTSGLSHWVTLLILLRKKKWRLNHSSMEPKLDKPLSHSKWKKETMKATKRIYVKLPLPCLQEKRSAFTLRQICDKNWATTNRRKELSRFLFFCFICHFYPPFTRKRIVSLYFGREVRTRLGVAFFEVYGPPVFHIKAGASR